MVGRSTETILQSFFKSFFNAKGRIFGVKIKFWSKKFFGQEFSFPITSTSYKMNSLAYFNVILYIPTNTDILKSNANLKSHIFGAHQFILKIHKFDS